MVSMIPDSLVIATLIGLVLVLAMLVERRKMK